MLVHLDMRVEKDKKKGRRESFNGLLCPKKENKKTWRKGGGRRATFAIRRCCAWTGEEGLKDLLEGEGGLKGEKGGGYNILPFHLLSVV